MKGKQTSTAGKIITAAAISGVMGIQLVKHTMAQRGYFAIGGEWIMTIMIFAMMLVAMEHWNRRKHVKHNRNAMQKTNQG